MVQEQVPLPVNATAKTMLSTFDSRGLTTTDIRTDGSHVNEAWNIVRTQNQVVQVPAVQNRRDRYFEDEHSVLIPRSVYQTDYVSPLSRYQRLNVVHR